MANESSELLVANHGRLRVITLNRPDRMNALTPELHHHVQEAVAAAAEDSSVGAVMLTGAGRAFCAGGDVNKSAERAKTAARPETVEERADSVRAHSRTVIMLHRMPKPTIAAINGPAIGAGLALALACDLRFMSADATLRTAYARIGLSGDLGISYFLDRLVGPARAAELMFLNDKITAEMALHWGLANRIFAADKLEGEALSLAQQLAQGPSVAFRYMKQNLALAQTGTLEEVIEREAYNAARCVRTQDVKEAALAFKEKRDPIFTGN